MTSQYKTTWHRCPSTGYRFDVIVPPARGITQGMIVRCPLHDDEAVPRFGTNGFRPRLLAGQAQHRARVETMGGELLPLYRVADATKVPYRLRGMAYAGLPAGEVRNA